MERTSCVLWETLSSMTAFRMKLESRASAEENMFPMVQITAVQFPLLFAAFTLAKKAGRSSDFSAVSDASLSAETAASFGLTPRLSRASK
eukprot:766973-Pyramimonas_sp.AAC.1